MKISKDHYECLHQRMRWMEIRSEGKDQIGWDSNYDKRERDALRAILAVVRPEDEATPKHPPVPEGWRVLEEHEVIMSGDQYLSHLDGGTWRKSLCDIGCRQDDFCYPHIRRIEPTYRPFASAEEFDAHANRIVVNIGTGTRSRIDHYSDKGCNGISWEMAHRKFRFLDDGTPFGVEVKE